MSYFNKWGKNTIQTWWRFKKGKKERCPNPNCNQKTYVRIELLDGTPLPYEYGRCDRECNCRYFNKPEKKDFMNLFETEKIVLPPKAQKGVYSFAKSQMIQTINREPNNLIKWLKTLFTAKHGADAVASEELIKKIVEKYCIGSDKYGNVMYWYADKNGNIRTAKIMQYNTAVFPENCKRTKGDNSIQYFLGKSEKQAKLLKIPDDQEIQLCFYLEHLISLPENINKPVGIVESEKTAIILNEYMPSTVWIASSGSNGITAEKMTALKGRVIVLACDFDVAGRKDYNNAVTFFKTMQYDIRLLDFHKELNNGEDEADIVIYSNVRPTGLTQNEKSIIIAHFKSYKMQYDYTDDLDCESLLKGLKSAYNSIIIDKETYRRVLSEAGVECKKIELPNKLVFDYFNLVPELYFAVREGRETLENCYKEFDTLHDTFMQLDEFEREFEKVTVILSSEVKEMEL